MLSLPRPNCSSPFEMKKKYLGSAIANEREPKSCLGRVFNLKLGCFAS
jgi:hypothetical protein